MEFLKPKRLNEHSKPLCENRDCMDLATGSLLRTVYDSGIEWMLKETLILPTGYSLESLERIFGTLELRTLRSESIAHNETRFSSDKSKHGYEVQVFDALKFDWKGCPASRKFLEITDAMVPVRNKILVEMEKDALVLLQAR